MLPDVVTIFTLSSKEYCGLSDASRLERMCSFFYIIYKQNMKSFAEARFEIAMFSSKTCGAATPGFNLLISAPSVPSLISTELVELLCRAGNVDTTDLFCFVKQKQKTIEVFQQFLFTNMRSSASVRRTKILGDKGCHTALITIKQEN